MQFMSCSKESPTLPRPERGQSGATGQGWISCGGSAGIGDLTRLARPPSMVMLRPFSVVVRRMLGTAGKSKEDVNDDAAAATAKAAGSELGLSDTVHKKESLLTIPNALTVARMVSPPHTHTLSSMSHVLVPHCVP